MHKEQLLIIVVLISFVLKSVLLPVRSSSFVVPVNVRYRNRGHRRPCLADPEGGSHVLSFGTKEG